MDNLDADFIIETSNLEAEYSVNPSETFACSFELFASGTTWGSIDGEMSNQTDLWQVLQSKADTVTVEALSETVTDNYNDLDGRITSDHSEITNIALTIQSFGDIVSYDAADFATAAQGALADTAVQPGDLATVATTGKYSDLIGTPTLAAVATSGSYDDLTDKPTIPTVNNATLTIQKNGTTVNTFTANASSNVTANITVPTDTSDLTNGAGFITSASLPTDYVPDTREVNGYALSSDITLTALDVGALSSSTTINDLTTTAQQNALNSGATSTNIGQIATNTTDIATINGKIPAAASTLNQLADKQFVNSSIATNTANFIGTFNSVAELEAYSGTLTNNDYAFVIDVDGEGNTVYDRYKYTDATTPPSWVFEYELNNSSFTATQWGAINSGITSADVTLIGTAIQPGDNVSDLINDAGYLTSSDVATVAISGDYSDLINKPSIPSSLSDITVSAGSNISISGDTISATDTTYSNFTGCDSITAGAAGLVPAPSAGDESKFLKANGTWDSIPGGGTVDQVYNSTSANAQSGIAIAGAKFVQNTATGTNALTLLGTATNQSGSINIGYGSSVTNSDSVVIGENAESAYAQTVAIGYQTNANDTSSTAVGYKAYTNYTQATAIGYNAQATAAGTVAIGSNSRATIAQTAAFGYNAKANNYGSTAVGYNAVANANYAIQIGNGTNSTASTLAVGFNGTNYQLLDGTTGLIPDARISTNIARTSDIPASEIFVATYGTTTYQEISDAITAGKTVMCKNSNGNIYTLTYSGNSINKYIFSYSGSNGTNGWIYYCEVDNANTWVDDYSVLADASLSGLSPQGQAKFDAKADTDLSNLSATGKKVIDGQWVIITEEILDGASLTNSSGTSLSKTVTLPDDDCIYEVMFRGRVTTGTTSGNLMNLQFQTNVFETTVLVCGARTRSNSSVSAQSTVIVPVKAGANNLSIQRSASYNGTADMVALAYRRVGTNT